jgi:hypothetical protein
VRGRVIGESFLAWGNVELSCQPSRTLKNHRSNAGWLTR